MPADWLFAVIVILVVTHLLLLAVAIYRGQQRLSAVGSNASPRDPETCVTDGGVRCPHCETVNDDEYRYCRSCVSELPTGVSFSPDSTGSRSRRTV